MKRNFLFSRSKAGSLAIRLTAFLAVVVLCFPSVAAAISSQGLDSILRNTPFFDPTDTTTICDNGSGGITADSPSNQDYSGQQILNSAQFEAINANQTVYATAAAEVDIPWQLLAVIHLRESGGKLTNPGNGHGLYQINNTKTYPPGTVTADDFLAQTREAAAFIKSKASSNYTNNQNLTASSSAAVIKDTLFSYNGRASAYAQQAAALGYNAGTEAYEGSPYVMNKADAKRDPSVAAAGTWGQIKTDGGAISYPADNAYGAFVVYASLAGISLTNSNCNATVSSATGVAGKVVAIAQQELALWNSGTLSGNGKDYLKYTYGAKANWCAYFASWVYNQAGYPISATAANGSVPGVAGIQAIGQLGSRFTWHAFSGYTPQPGDLVIYGSEHVNIVTAVSGGQVTVIGGNQGYASGQASSYSNSLVTSNNISISGLSQQGATGYVSPITGGQ